MSISLKFYGPIFKKRKKKLKKRNKQVVTQLLKAYIHLPNYNVFLVPSFIEFSLLKSFALFSYSTF